MARLYINVEGAVEAPGVHNNQAVVYAIPPQQEEEEEPYISPHTPIPLAGSYVVEESYNMLDQVVRWYYATDPFSRSEMLKHIESFFGAINSALNNQEKYPLN